MIRILICDDSETFTQKLRADIRGVLEETGVAISTYSGLEEIPEPVLTGCDIAFLDIDFSGKRYNGLDIAGRLRQLRPDAVIIFVTNYVEYAPEGYEVGAFRYILKHEITQKLPLYLAQALAQLHTDREVLKISSNGELIDIPISDIRYIESRQHMAVIHTGRRDYTCYSSLSELEKELADRGFLRIHKSCLVNMAHLKRYQSTGAELSDGTLLRVSARSYAVQKQKYLLWKGRL